jgi:TatD DNase family protein
MLIDSHCHVNFNAYKEDGEEVIKRSLDQQVWLINIGSQSATSERSIRIADKYPVGVYAVVGLHPIHLMQDVTETASFEGETYEFTTRQEDFDKEKYRGLAKSSKKVVGLGETGLDYWYFDEFSEARINEAKKIQKRVFEEFIDLSVELGLPLVIHCRGTKADLYGAYDDAYEILRAASEKYGRPLRGVIHCFTGTAQQTRKFLDLGFFIGFTGLITFKKKVEWLWEIVRQTPLEKILIETDAPFLSPEPHRGKRNEPAYVRLVAQKVAELKGLPLEKIAEVTTANARELFGI